MYERGGVSLWPLFWGSMVGQLGGTSPPHKQPWSGCRGGGGDHEIQANLNRIFHLYSGTHSLVQFPALQDQYIRLLFSPFFQVVHYTVYIDRCTSFLYLNLNVLSSLSAIRFFPSLSPSLPIYFIFFLSRNSLFPQPTCLLLTISLSPSLSLSPFLSSPFPSLSLHERFLRADTFSTLFLILFMLSSLPVCIILPLFQIRSSSLFGFCYFCICFLSLSCPPFLLVLTSLSVWICPAFLFSIVLTLCLNLSCLPVWICPASLFEFVLPLCLVLSSSLFGFVLPLCLIALPFCLDLFSLLFGLPCLSVFIYPHSEFGFGLPLCEDNFPSSRFLPPAHLILFLSLSLSSHHSS